VCTDDAEFARAREEEWSEGVGLAGVADECE
jgi:hypothetical protein